MVGGNAAQMFQTLLLGRWISLLGSRKMCALSSEANTEDLLILKSLLESGEIRPVIDRGYPLHEVAEAIRYLEAGHARGKVVVTMEHNDPV